MGAPFPSTLVSPEVSVRVGSGDATRVTVGPEIKPYTFRAAVTPGQPLVVPLEIGGTVERPRIRATQDWSRDVIRRALGGSGMGDLLERLMR